MRVKLAEVSLAKLIIALVGLGFLFIVGWILSRAYLKFRGVRLVTCPETERPAAVEVDAKHAAFSTVFGQPSLQVKNCSRWPERRGCGRECLGQVEVAPEDCLVRTIVAKWYKEKSCVFCGKAIEEVNWLDHYPALLSPDRVTFEWSEILPEKLPEALATHTPVCWNCHIAQTFRRRFPELVVDRPLKRGRSHRMN